MIWVGLWGMSAFGGVVAFCVLYEELRAIRRQRLSDFRRVILEEVKAYARQHDKVTLGDILKVIAP